MKRKKIFLSNEHGVHLLSPHDPSTSICGSPTAEGWGGLPSPAVPVKTQIVTCPECIALINHCRGVRVQTRCLLEHNPHDRLIAAAPYLLESCQQLIETFHQYSIDVDDADVHPTYDHPTYDHREMMKKAKAAVSKATAV